MIVFIEGSRHVGKTFLIDQFLKQNTDKSVEYYKFKFAKYIDEFDMRDQETGPGVHYFSIGNILTILELNETLLKDKILIFDRCIFSAYVWSIYRNRLSSEKLMAEFEKILNHDLYKQCKLVYITKDETIVTERREKDYFGNFENYSEERQLFDLLLDRFKKEATDSDKGNELVKFVNLFDEQSGIEFCKMMNKLVKHS
jgi:hypothetical protein